MLLHSTEYCYQLFKITKELKTTEKLKNLYITSEYTRV